MQIGVRTLASKLGQTGLQKLVAMGAIPAQRLCTKRAFTATIGMSNAELVKNRAALGKKMELVARHSMLGITTTHNDLYPELSRYVAKECHNAHSEVPLRAHIGDITIIGSADFIFDDTQGKRILSEYKTSMYHFPNSVGYLQAILYALIYNRFGAQSKNTKIKHKYIDRVEWLNPITGLHCTLLADPQQLCAKDNLEKIISVYFEKIN
ncbi:hypothetical protein F-VV10_0431 [Faustovirus]|nr:hypothetical protein F-VV10_0431 [Faustovirus]